MSKYRFLLSFLVTSLIYLTAGFTLLYFSQTVNVSDKKSFVKTIELSLQAYQPEIVEQRSEPIKEETPPPVEKTPPPEPIIEKPKPLEQPKPEPIVQKQEIKKPKEKKEKLKNVVKKTKKPPTQKISALKSSKKQQSTAEEKNLFLAKVRDRINRNKHYPNIAKRRGMQGSVRISFTILSNGQVSGITVNGPKVFHTSAKEAVQKAFPIAVKNIPISLPEQVSVTLHYKLSR
ncbi:energy transducer TonB [Sulfurovum sp. zt1-1]|uniref:Energy transducer TonB n=1 Tax=Sulfurovum zhangzhouensis TaxID=3019067 RepID=A0ABT7QXD2_9BACT|nr:energy transducer TonB [Sulfurovum zhangzhouensis]MDM5271453.1 energy transducer TonB [Sulfurovum zhangzhouensis]